MEIQRHEVVRYVVPLREGGSLPAVLETEQGELFVAKFRGAGQGAGVLVAELICAYLARAVDLPVPDAAVLNLPEGFGRTERDPEIQDILKGSVGTNMGLRFLEGALNFNPVADRDLIAPEFASRLVWFDAFLLNVDRTVRNPNLMTWGDEVYLIDHGSALYIHHDWASITDDRMRMPFSPIAGHVLLTGLQDAHAVGEEMAARLPTAVFEEAVMGVPDELLTWAPHGKEPFFTSGEAAREAYVRLLRTRLEARHTFETEAMKAAERARATPPAKLGYRR